MLILICIFVLLGLNACAKDTDKVVVESEAVEQFKMNKDTKQDFLFDKALIDKVILIEGVVKEINNLNNRYTIILKRKSKTSRFVICDMQHNQKDKFKTLKVNDTITVKGILKGTLKDFILLNCIISN